jgi:endonuclease YncB( thermonuclease family)
MVALKNVTTEKYGRILADVFLDKLDVGKWMVEKGLAVEYHGGKKEDFK